MLPAPNLTTNHPACRVSNWSLLARSSWLLLPLSDHCKDLLLLRCYWLPAFFLADTVGSPWILHAVTHQSRLLHRCTTVTCSTSVWNLITAPILSHFLILLKLPGSLSSLPVLHHCSLFSGPVIVPSAVFCKLAFFMKSKHLISAAFGSSFITNMTIKELSINY